MIRRALVTLAALVPVVALAGEGPSLDETFNWLMKALKVYGDTRWTNDAGCPVVTSTRIAKVDGCKVSLHREDAVQATPDGRCKADRTFKDWATDLAEYDPSSSHAHSDGGGTWVTIEKTDFMTSHVLISVASDHEGERVEKAFSHAIRGCGGKNAPF